MKRDFQFITRGKILTEIKAEGLPDFNFSQLHRFEKKGIIPVARRMGGRWRVYSREEADNVKELVQKWYAGKIIL